MFYGILLWGKSDYVQTMDKIQKRAMRLISYSRPLKHTEPHLKVFNFLKFNDIYSQFLNTILEHAHIQPFIGFSRFITNYFNSLYI